MGLPVCPRGHESAKVVRDGAQKRGGRERQRYRCVLADGSYHRFVGAVSHTRGDGKHCDECDRPLTVDGGPVAPWRSRYLVKEVAAALWAIAGGASYTDAALRVRRRAWGEDGAERRAATTVAWRARRKRVVYDLHRSVGFYASIFLVLADRKLRAEGTLALVMPLSLLSGDAWENSRRALARGYSDLILVSIAGAADNEMSFSADTDMGECLIVGRKAAGGSGRATSVCRCSHRAAARDALFVQPPASIRRRAFSAYSL